MAVFGSDLFVTDLGDARIGHYTTSGATVNGIEHEIRYQDALLHSA